MRRLRSRLLRTLQPMVPASDVLARLAELPFADADALIGPGGVLVLAPHPDDESLGCGGLIALCRERGRDVHVMIITDGTASHRRSRDYPRSRLAALREREVRAAVAELGLAPDHLIWLGLTDGEAPLFGPRLRRVAALVERYARAHGVATILATWPHDPHRDHKATYRLGRLAARAVGARLLCYPVWGWTLPQSAWLPAGPLRGGRIDITAQRVARARAVACHGSQLTDLITDDPTAFRLSAEHLAVFDKPFEVFVEP
jgi:LmbE family N-acetylglucosaminyl deacetylase